MTNPFLRSIGLRLAAACKARAKPTAPPPPPKPKPKPKPKPDAKPKPKLPRRMHRSRRRTNPTEAATCPHCGETFIRRAAKNPKPYCDRTACRRRRGPLPGNGVWFRPRGAGTAKPHNGGGAA